MRINDHFHMNDCVLANVPILATGGYTHIRLCKVQARIAVAMDSMECDKTAILLLAQELTGSEENAKSFLNGFKSDINTFSAFFAEEVQNRIITALHSAYTMMQIGCPERYNDHVLAGGEFNSFAELLTRCYQDVGVSSKSPSISMNLTFLIELSKSSQHTARTKALALEKQFKRFFNDYATTPVGIGEVSSKHQYTKKEKLTPFLSYLIIYFLMSPLSQGKRDEILLQLATRLGKAMTDVTIHDILSNKTFVHDQINFASGAKASFSYETWSKTAAKTITPAIRTLRSGPRLPKRRPAYNRRRSRSRSREQGPSRGRTPTRREVRSQTPAELDGWASTVLKTFSPKTRSRMAALINPSRSRSRDRRRSSSNRRRPGQARSLTEKEPEDKEVPEETSRESIDIHDDTQGTLPHQLRAVDPQQSPMFVVAPSMLIDPSKPFRVIYDTGASSSCVPIQFVRNLVNGTYNWSTDQSPSSTIDASGNKIKVYPDLLDIDLLTKGNPSPIKIRGAIVADFKNKSVHSQILLGISDIRANKINLVHQNDKSVLKMNGKNLSTVFATEDLTELRKMANQDRTPRRSFPLPPVKAPSFSEIQNTFSRSPSPPDLWISSTKKCSLPTVPPVPSSVAATKDHAIATKTSSLIDSPSNPDAKLTLRRSLDLEYHQSINTFSHEDIKFDPEDTLKEVWPSETISQRIQQIKNIILKYKRVFRGDIGEVRDDNFLVRASIDHESSTLSTNRCRNYYESMSEAVKQAVLDKFRRELAQRVLVPTSTLGIVPKNVLPVFGIPKKGATGKEILLDASRVRLIADCSKGVNKATTHRAAATDDIRFIARKVARYSKTGFTFSVDVADAFYCFKLSPDLVPYFCIHHPEYGMCAYTRLPQGWVSSPQNCRDFLHFILINQNKHLVRYLDDICGGAESWDEFLTVFEGLLKTLEYYNLRLKGSKVTILGKSLDFLGKKIVDGKIYPNPHTIDRINSYEPSDITTIGQMLSFIGMMSYISDHIFQSSTVLHDLRQACKGAPAEHFQWTEDHRKKFQEAKNAISRCVVLAAPSTDLPHFLVVDTSKIATGAVLFAKNGDEKLVLGIFSRKRTDIENKTATPSCVAELAGIGAALKYFSPSIADLQNPLTILTDSKSAAAAYDKFRVQGHPTTNMRLSAFLNTAYGLNYKLVYVKNSEPDIKCVDFLSRLVPKSQRECTNCKVCEVAKYIADAKPLTQSTYHEFLNAVQRSLQRVSFEDPPPIIEDVASQILHLLHKPRALFRISPAETEFWKDRSIHFSYLRAVTRSRSIPQFDGPLAELLRNSSIIREWQSFDKHIKEAKRCLHENQDAHSAPVKTILHNQKAYLDSEDILRRNVPHKTSVFKLIFIPANKFILRNLVEILHSTKGHSTKVSFQNELKRLFHAPGIDQELDRKIKNCPGCMLIRQPRNTPRTFKATPIPNHIGEVILVDEIHRTFRSKPIKFLLASDCLSRYTRLYPFEGPMDTNLFVKLLLRVSDDFLFHQKSPSSSLEIRCDHLPAHTKALEDPRLIERKIKIEFHDPTSANGKQIPELDGRMAKISKFLTTHSLTSLDAETLAWQAAKSYNETRASEGFCPWELWNRQRMGTNQTFDPPISELKEAIAKSRLASRKSVEKAINHRSGPPLNFVEYAPGLTQDYTSRTYTPLELGDLFLLNMAWDKNNSTPYYIISKVPEVPNGINFDERLVGARKVGVKSTAANKYYFSFDAIRLVLDGNTPEAKDFISKANPKQQSQFIRNIFEEGYPITLKPNTDLYSPQITWDDFLHVEKEFDAHSNLTDSAPKQTSLATESSLNDSSPMIQQNRSQKARHSSAKRPFSRVVNFRTEKTVNSRKRRKIKKPSPSDYIPGNNSSQDLIMPEYTGPQTRSKTRSLMYI